MIRYSSIEESSLKIKTCEMHTCGEPVRIIESLNPPLIFPENSNILEKRRYLKFENDHIRKMAILEPRGHKDMFGAIVTDPDPNSECDFGLLFLNNEGYSTMCGHATIAVARYLIEKQLVKITIPETEIKFNCPCGLVKVWVEFDGTEIGNCKFHSVSAFVQEFDYKIFVPSIEKTVKCDIAFGGNFYIIVSCEELNVDFSRDTSNYIVDAATYLQQEIEQCVKLHHPTNKDVEYFYGVIVTDGRDEFEIVKTMCIFGNKAFDRSPCGSGTTALVACQYFRGKMKIGQYKIAQNAFLGENSQFLAKPIKELTISNVEGELNAIVVEICGQANFIGESLLFHEEDDAFKFGISSLQ